MKLPLTTKHGKDQTITYTLQLKDDPYGVSIEYLGNNDKYLSNNDIVELFLPPIKNHPITPDSKAYDDIVMFVQSKWVTNTDGKAALLIEDVEELIRLSTGIETDLNLESL